MTQVITRYFETEEKTRSVRKTLELEGFPRKALRVFTDPKSVVDALTAEHVDPATAKAYADRLKSGGAVLLAKATFKPLGAAKLTRQVTADMGAVDMGDLSQEVYVKDKPGQTDSVLTDHPLFLSRKKGAPRRKGNYMADWPIPLISRRKPADEFGFPRHARMANWPIGLLLSGSKRYGRFPFDLLIPGQKYMAKFPFGHLVSHSRRYGRFPFGLLVPGQKYMAKFPFGHIVPGHKYMAKFPFGHLVPGHRRMANWPFPLLIDGETGTNSLVPNGARMANFPIPLKSDRKPSDKFAFPRHARMASFPISLTSKRKPFTGSAIPRHGRMADAILPLVIKHAESKATAEGTGFSFSKFLNIPTLTRG